MSYNAFYSIGNALSHNGKPTAVIYGFLRKVLQASLKFKTDNVVFCWDAGYTWRHQHYPGYKGARKARRDAAPPDEKQQYMALLDQQVRLNHSILPMLGLKNSFCFKYYEGDDLIGQVVRKHFKNQRKIIFTSDNDLFQLLDEADIFLLHTKKLFTHDDFKEKYGIYADQWPLAKAIGGCSGDNIAGIQGVSDPKNTTSKALKYIKGTLTKGEVYKRIKSQEQSLVAYNLPFVTVPYLPDKMPEFKFRKNRVTRRRLIKQFDKYRFISFLEKPMFSKWERGFVNGY